MASNLRQDRRLTAPKVLPATTPKAKPKKRKAAVAATPNTEIQSPIPISSKKAKSTPASGKKVASPLTGQAVKMFQHLAAVASYQKITELTATRTDNLNRKLEEYFLGSDTQKTVGQIIQLVEGTGVYANLWQTSSSNTENKTVAAAFTIYLNKLSDITPAMLQPDLSKDGRSSNILGNASSKSKKNMAGRNILKNVEAAIRECKKACAFWLEFLVDDKFPSSC